jgi:hypothetical protein
LSVCFEPDGQSRQRTAVAEQALEDMKARAETINDTRSALQSVITVAAVATDLPLETAFTVLATGKIAA